MILRACPGVPPVAQCRGLGLFGAASSVLGPVAQWVTGSGVAAAVG